MGFYTGLPSSVFDTFGEGIDATQRINFDKLQEFLGGNRLVEIGGGPGNSAIRYMESPTGEVVGPVDAFSYNDPTFSAAIGALLSGFGAPLLSPYLGTAGASAAISGGLSALQGGSAQDILKSALVSAAMPTVTGAVSGPLGQATDFLKNVGGETFGNVASNALRSGTQAGIAALAGGKDIGEAFTRGLIGGGVGSGVNALGGEYFPDLPAPLQRGITNAAVAAALGNDPSNAFINSVIRAAPGYFREQDQQELIQRAYSDPSRALDVLQGTQELDMPDYGGYSVQDLGATPEALASYDRTMQGVVDRGGFTSQWQTVGSDRIMLDDEGTGIGINTETGETYALSPEEVQRMIDADLLNTDTSGYGQAIRGPVPSAPAPTPAPRAPIAAPTTAPAPAPTPEAADGGFDLSALMNLLTPAGAPAAPPPAYESANIGDPYTGLYERYY
jgi:hypothetical protein